MAATFFNAAASILSQTKLLPASLLSARYWAAVPVRGRKIKPTIAPLVQPKQTKDKTRHPRAGPVEAAYGPLGTLTGATDEILGWTPHYRHTKGKRRIRPKKGTRVDPETYKGKPVQEWQDWDGFGPYKYRHHCLPSNHSARDWQRRRIFEQHAEQRLRINAVRKADILPAEIRRLADQEIHSVPKDSGVTRINRRCTVTGRSRGIFHQFRMSRMTWRQEADYNKVSGAIRAKWMYGIKIEP